MHSTVTDGPHPILIDMIRFFSLLAFAAILTACGPSGTEVESSEAVMAANTATASATFTVDTSASTVEWAGAKLIGSGHHGVIPIEQGALMTDDGKLVGGTFTLNITRLENRDLDGENKGKLEGHLKSADFFDVANHPTAQFEITSVIPVADQADFNHNITGNLTLKGTSRSITIPAMVSMDGDQITATTPDFVIDRTEWGMQYGSGSGAVELAQDKIINDEVGLKLNLVAMK